MYTERPARPAGAVLWTRTVPAGPVSCGGGTSCGQQSYRVLPDGCLDLIWVDGELIVAGPDPVAHLAPVRPGARYVGLRFAPGTGATVLRVPADELLGRRVPLADLWPAAVVRRLAEAPDPGAALEEVALARLTRTDPLLEAVVRLAATGTPVAGIAAAVCLSERQLHRRCRPAFGYGPQTLTRILRLGRALESARAGQPLARVAALTGYADQAHLSREVRALAGVPLRVLLR